jgi:lysophospholipase L1-like esterase
MCPAPPPTPQSSNGQAIAVTYGAASVTDGTQPVSTVCTPPSGSSFNVGSTTVTCKATDAVQRTASCVFAVNVVFTPPAPRLTKAKFVAFGDSITQGAVPDSYVSSRFKVLRLLPNEKTYPGQLDSMLKQRYTAQPVSVCNRGKQGERADQGVTRLGGVLDQDRPDVLLLLEGINDLDQTSSNENTVNALQMMIADAHDPRRGSIDVMIGTLLALNPEECMGCISNSQIMAFNSRLIVMAHSQNATVVDLYPVFAAHTSDWLTFDGLHPNETGYQQLAQVFFDAIKTAYEVPGSATNQGRRRSQ